MEKKKLKIGAFPGKFLPPHLGHISTIKECAKKCDILYVVVADHEDNSRALCEKAGLPFITARTRVKWLKAHFKHDKNIKIIYMNEAKIGAFPAPMDKWSDYFKKVTHHKINMKFADETYRELNEKHFSECEFVCFDRQKINISGTKVRENPEKYFDFIIAEAQPFFKKVLDLKKQK